MPGSNKRHISNKINATTITIIVIKQPYCYLNSYKSKTIPIFQLKYFAIFSFHFVVKFCHIK